MKKPGKILTTALVIILVGFCAGDVSLHIETQKGMKQINSIFDLLISILIHLLKFGLLGLIVGYGLSSKIGWIEPDLKNTPELS